MTSKCSVPGCILALLACFTFDLQSAPTNSPPVVHSAPAVEASKPAPLKSAAVPLARTAKSHVHQRQVELPAFSAAEMEAIKQQDIPEARKRLRVGVGRELVEPVTVNAQ